MTKQEGIAELLRKVASYPPDTVFYFQTWTYGYEEVWLALSKALKSPIHVDEYKMRIYTSLSSKIGDHRFASLTGYMCGNAWHPGCLTTDESARLHSCEKGNLCSVASQPNVVKIQPIVAHLANGTDIAEAGVGGGGNDFQRDAELGSLSPQDFRALQELIKRTGKGHDGFLESLAQKMASGRDMPLGLAMDQFGEHLTASIEKLSGMPSPPERTDSSANTTLPASQAGLPRVIRFPYARHSSYEELCHFVDAFKPRDVWPCTENAQQWWRKGYSIASYFGDFCSGNDFAYDRMVKETYPEPPPPQEDEDEDEDAHDTQTTGRVSVVAFGEEEAPLSSPVKTCLLSESRGRDDVGDDDDDRPDSTPKRARRADDTAGQDESQQHSVASHMTETDSAVRWEAYTRTLARLHDDGDDDDDDDGGSLSLLSTTDHHSKCHAETQPKRIVAAQKESSHRCLFLFPNQFGHVDAPARHVALADAQIDATRQVLAQLRAQRPHFGLAQRRGLFLLALAPTPATASEPCKLVFVVLDAELVGRAAQPRVLAVRFFLCQHRVRQLLGQVCAGLEPRDNLLVKRQRLNNVVV
ncbi:hypothetical protein BBAD15_g7885 [Beauveria bassiana D1-5]|uniref:Protein artemis n=1 Tax=Beauveria bassiana D1-5 TaxID=1245745 RepID=A0A0A2VKF5_BEABA|nr:hypothetical protein BBAD15_g7885 [Beauveria bassiana D1-5]